jgi:hypothetical protein
MEIRFGEWQRKTSMVPKKVDYSAITRKRRALPKKGRHGKPTRDQILRIVRPYLKAKISDQLRAVLPLALYLIVFQFLVLGHGIQNPYTIAFGLGAVVIGLMVFMEGLQVGLMPFGKAIGHELPSRLPLPMVMLVAFLLGVGVTFAEPAIGALKIAGSLVQPVDSPYLYAMLGPYSIWLVLTVGMGVGVAAILGMMRFLKGWSLKPMIIGSLGLTMGLTYLAMQDEDLRGIISLAWDCGAVTTGPVTVPLVLALGIGVAGSTGEDNSSLSGFGIVTLASLFPIAAVLGLGLTLRELVPAEDIISAAYAMDHQSIGWWHQSPFTEIISGVRAIVPLVLFLAFVATYLAKVQFEDKSHVRFGILLTVLGMIIFNLGLTYGLAALGTQAGEQVPAAFTQIEGIERSPIYPYAIGLGVTLVFAWVLGFGSTLAEPALNTLGITVEDLTSGALKRRTLVLAVSIGVAFGIMLGVVKLMFNIPLPWLIGPGYMLALALTLFSDEEYVDVAWDSAGVTTGPVTVPLVLALGLGLGKAIGVAEGFGILAMASVCPIISVLSVGLFTRWQIRRAARVAGKTPVADAA